MNVKEIMPVFKDDLLLVEGCMTVNFRSDIPLIPTVSKHLAEGGGKRLRPLLLLICSRLTGYDSSRHADLNIKCAAAIEYIHIASLLHDDVIDTADMRRGRRSANVKWGNSASVLVGDYLFAKAFSILSQKPDPLVMQTISSSTVYLTEGEVRQLNNLHNINISTEDYYDTIEGKTAALIAAACKVGGIIGGGSNEDIDRLESFGRNIGIAFQLIDDLLDYTSNEQRLGKPVNDDIKRGNVTLPLIYLYEKSSDRIREDIERAVSGEAEEDEIAKVVQMVGESGAVKHLLERCQGYIASAKEAIAPLGQSEYTKYLEAMADYVMEREM